MTVYRILFFHHSTSLIQLETIDRQILSVLIILNLPYFGKNNSWKMEALLIFGLWYQKIDLWFMNHKSLIPTLYLDIWSHVVAYSEPCVTLVYLESCHIQNSDILLCNTCILRTLPYLELCYVKIFLAYF